MAYLHGGQPSVKAISGIPGWAVDNGTGKITSGSLAYERIPVIRRGVDILADSLLHVPHAIETADGEEGEWPFVEELDSLLSATAKAYLIEGAAYWEKIKNRVQVTGVQWLNPTTMKVEFVGRRQDGTLGLKFTQEIGSGQPKTWDETQMVYFRQWQLSDDIEPGKSIVMCVLDSANLTYYITRFAKTFFEQGAQPTLLVIADGNPQDEEVKRVESFFKRMISGVNNAFRVLGLKNAWDIKVVTPPMDTLAMPELSEYSIRQVAIGMGIPETMLTDAANYATAAQHDTQFWQNSILPLAEMLAGVINKSLLVPMGLKLCFYPEMMDVFQEDEAQRAQSLQALTASGLPVDFGMQLLGYELPDGMTYDELALMLEERKPPIPQPPQLQPDAVVAGRQDVTPPAGRYELRAWQRKTEKRVKAGKGVPAFESDEIPVALKAAVEGALENAPTLPEVRRVFGNALAWVDYQ